jgi:hypothetical protein
MSLYEIIYTSIETNMNQTFTVKFSEDITKIAEVTVTNTSMEGLYRHFKGKPYKVHGTGMFDGTVVVVYECLYENEDGKLWYRPMEMFLENVDKPNYSGPRFYKQ